MTRRWLATRHWRSERRCFRSRWNLCRRTPTGSPASPVPIGRDVHGDVDRSTTTSTAPSRVTQQPHAVGEHRHAQVGEHRRVTWQSIQDGHHDPDGHSGHCHQRLAVRPWSLAGPRHERRRPATLRLGGKCCSGHGPLHGTTVQPVAPVFHEGDCTTPPRIDQTPTDTDDYTARRPRRDGIRCSARSVTVHHWSRGQGGRVTT